MAIILPAVPAAAIVSDPRPTAPVASSAASAYIAVTPTRVLDTRSTGGGGPIGEQGTRNLVVAGGTTSVPAGATGVVLNTTVTNTTANSYLTVYPTGAVSPPFASNLNWLAFQTVPNLVSVQVGTGGSVTFFNRYGSTDVVADLEGYFIAPGSSTAGGEVSLTPSRILDTRSGAKLGENTSMNVQITGKGGVPATGVSGVILNATVTNTSAPSYLTIWPAGATQPNASNLNWLAGWTRPNRVFVPVGTGGQISVFNKFGSTDVVLDVNGYFTDATASGDLFSPGAPIRLDDHHPLGENTSYTLGIAGVAGVPANATGVILNVVTSETTLPSYLTIWPSSASMPLASDLNWVAGWVNPNLTAVGLGTAGAVSIFNRFGSANVTVDLEGYFAPAAPPPPKNTVSVSASPPSIAANGTSTSTVTATVTAPGGGAVAGDTITFSTGSPSATGSCGSVSPTSMATNASGVATTTYTSSATAGTCTVTATEQATSPGTGASGSTTITQTGGNQTYSVTPTAAASQAQGTSRSYTATGIPAGQAVDIELFNCDNVQNNAGTFTFTGSNPGSATSNNAVQGNVNNNSITVVNGTPASGTQVNGISPSAGAVTFTITNADTGNAPQSCVTPVVFQQPASGNNLALGANNQPSSQAFGVGGSTTFAPVAPTSTTTIDDVFVQSVGSSSFIGCTTESRSGSGGAGSFGPPCYLLTWKSSDSFFMQRYPGGPDTTGSYPASNQAEFIQHLTPFDRVDVNCHVGSGACNYSSNPATPNAWGLSNTDPKAPADNTTNSSSVTATTGTTSSTFTTVTVKWTDSDTPTAGSYNVYRASTTTTVTACPSYPNSPAAAGTSAYVKAGTVADKDPAATNGATTYSFADPGLTPNTQYCYVVSAVDGTDENVHTGPTSVIVGFGPTAPTPISTQSVLTQGSNAGQVNNILDSGDTLQFTFSNVSTNPLTVTSGASITLSDSYGAVVSLTNGTNATFLVSGGGTVLTISVTGAPTLISPATPGSTSPTPTSLNTQAGAGQAIVVVSETGIGSAAGAWNLPASGCQSDAPSGCSATNTRENSGTTASNGATHTTSDNLDNPVAAVSTGNFTVDTSTNTITISHFASSGNNHIDNNDAFIFTDGNGNQIASGTWSNTTDTTVHPSPALTPGQTIYFVYTYQFSNNTGTTATRNTNWPSRTTQLSAPTTTPTVNSVSGTQGSATIVVHWNLAVNEVGPASNYTVTGPGGPYTGTATSGSGTPDITVTLDHALATGTTGPYTLSVAAGTVTNSSTGTPNPAQTKVFSPPTSAPTVAGVSPSNGPAAGGTAVDVFGTGFQPGAGVWFLCTTANATQTATFVSSTQLHIASTTANPDGSTTSTCDVKVQNPDLGTDTKTSAWTYTVGAPVLVTAVPDPSTKKIHLTFNQNVTCPTSALAVAAWNFDNLNNSASVGSSGAPASVTNNPGANPQMCDLNYTGFLQTITKNDYGQIDYAQPALAGDRVTGTGGDMSSFGTPGSTNGRPADAPTQVSMTSVAGFASSGGFDGEDVDITLNEAVNCSGQTNATHTFGTVDKGDFTVTINGVFNDVVTSVGCSFPTNGQTKVVELFLTNSLTSGQTITVTSQFSFGDFNTVLEYRHGFYITGVVHRSDGNGEATGEVNTALVP